MNRVTTNHVITNNVTPTTSRKFFNKNNLLVALFASATAISGIALAKTSIQQPTDIAVPMEISEISAIKLDTDNRANIDEVMNKLKTNQPLSASDKQLLLADFQQMLAIQGIELESLDHLQLKKMSSFELKQQQQHYASQHQAQLRSLTESIQKSDSIQQAQTLLQKFVNNELDTDTNNTLSNQPIKTSKTLNAEEVKQLFADMTLELGGVGYRVTYSQLPTVTVYPSTSMLTMEVEGIKTLHSTTANKQKVVTDELEVVLSDEGNPNNAKKHIFMAQMPMMEIGMVDDAQLMADDRLQQQLTTLANRVMHSDDVQQGMALISEFEKTLMANETVIH